MLQGAAAGDARAAAALFTALYDELHGIAESQLRRAGGELTLGATTLVHEAYLRIAAREGLSFADRNQFLAYAARAMRGLAIDHVRRRGARKRGGGVHFVVGEDWAAPVADTSPEALDRLNAALDALGGVHPALSQLVDLHFFAGFTLQEIAAMRQVSERTVQRDLRKVRLLLFDMLEPPRAPSTP